jgi:hypothetical protein
MLRNEGFESAMVDLGEFIVAGHLGPSVCPQPNRKASVRPKREKSFVVTFLSSAKKAIACGFQYHEPVRERR